MQRARKLWLAKGAVILGAVPLILWAYEYGPDPGYSGVPTDNGGETCATSGCHTGTTNNPANKGSVTVNFPNGMTYTPGVAQQLSVTIADPASTQQAYGFQLTARVAGNTATMAGAFAYADNNTLVMCSEPNLFVFHELCKSPQAEGCDMPGATSCPSGFTLQFIEHSYAGYLNSLQPPHNLSYTYNFTWTPPAANVGDITIYVAGNAGVGGVPNADGDHIYAAQYTLTPAAAANAPAITSVSNAASAAGGIVPNSWVSIFGSNFAPSGFTDTWANSIANGNLPQSLDGIKVSIGGQPAYIYFVSSGQINVVAPNVGTGSMQVVVTNASGSASAPFTVTSLSAQPAFFLWPGNYAVATHTDFTWAVNNGEFAGVTTAPAKPGEYIILWGASFGVTSPAAPIGVQLPSSPLYSTPSSTPVTVTIGGQNATVYQNSATLAPGFAGLFQVVVQVPASLGNADYPVIASINGAPSPSTTMLTVHN
jgi:uncharacterized protein (TIGR03437 family)